MLLVFLLCLMHHSIDGYLHHWLKINHDRALIKNADNYFQLSIHMNDKPSQEVSKSAEKSIPSIFIDNKNNLLRILNRDKWTNTSRQDLGDRNVVDHQIKCDNKFGICEEAVNYPDGLLEKELNANPIFRYLEVNETRVEVEVGIGNRFGGNAEFQYLCQSKKQYIRPKVAVTESEQVSFVVNNDKFVQLIEIETCINTKKTCDFSENFPEGYRSMCQQKYVYRKLLAIDSSEKLEPKLFKIPAGCCCGVWLHDGF